MKRGILLILLIMAASVSAQTITRSFNATQIYVDGTVEVTLSVVVAGADAYAIDETVPASWSVVDPGTASTQHSGHLKWVVVGEQGSGGYDCTGMDSCVSSLSDTTYTYILQAPSSTGTAQVTGVYMFDIGSSQTLGPDTLTVIARPAGVCGDYTNQAACSGATEDCAWCSLDSTCKASSQVLCTVSGCYNTTHECRNTCNIVNCGSGRECDTGSDVCVDIDDDDDDDDDGGNGGNGGTTCSSSWSCTDWTPAACPTDTRKQTRTCSDSNNCNPSTDVQATTRTCRLSGSTDTGGTTTTTTPTDRTRGTSGTTTTTTGTTSSRERTTSNEGTERDAPKTAEEVLDDSADSTNFMFYGLLALVIVLIVGAVYYLRHRGSGGISLNKGVNLSKQQKFVQQNNPWKPV